MAKQLAEVFQHGFGLGRFGAHQRNRTVERVEQKMRPDARLQLGQPRRRGRRCARLGAPEQAGQHHGRQQGAGGGAGPPRRRLQQPHQRQQAAAVQARSRSQQHAGEPLVRRLQPVQARLERADGDQPGQRGGQHAAGQQGKAQQPLARPASAKHRAHADHRLHKQHRAQHHADMAGVEHAGARRRCGQRFLLPRKQGAAQRGFRERRWRVRRLHRRAELTTVGLITFGCGSGFQGARCADKIARPSIAPVAASPALPDPDRPKESPT